MKIGQFSDSFYPIVDGVGRVVFQYATQLGQRGHESYVIAPTQDTGYRGNFPFEIVDYDGMPVPNTPQYRNGMPTLDTHYSHRIEKIPLEIVHAHSPFIAGQEALRIASKLKIPVVGTFHSKFYDDFYKLSNSEIIASVGVKYVVNFFNHCNEVWAVNQSSANVLSDYGYHGEIVVMPNGAIVVEPDPAWEARSREHFHLSSDPILFFCGQINFKKNINTTLAACALLKNQGAAFQLVLTGQGPDEKAILKMVEELGLSERTVYTGHIADTALLNGLYLAASLFVFPSVYDNAPMVVREAAALGTPSVVVRGSSAAESIHPGENGLVCENSPEDLAAVIADALAAPEKLAAMGEDARKTICIPWSQIIDQVVDRYQNLIDTHHK